MTKTLVLIKNKPTSKVAPVDTDVTVPATGSNMINPETKKVETFPQKIQRIKTTPNKTMSDRKEFVKQGNSKKFA